ncbi:hypothetical protein MD484_g459, partial [Candolleomyces efflorescens]
MSRQRNRRLSSAPSSSNGPLLIAMLFPALLVAVLTCHVLSSVAWTPASPSNSTTAAEAAGLNLTDTSILTLEWYSQGMPVSLASRANDGTGRAKGAFVHFSEEDVTTATPAVNVPWIAFIDCDRNATGASLETDIITLAKSKGAAAALLYSQTSTTCILDPVYRSWDPVLDVYTTQRATSSRLIDSQFGQITISAEPLVDYDPERFEYHSGNITATIQGTSPTAPGYIVATLEASNGRETSGGTVGGDSGGGVVNVTTVPSTQSSSSTTPPGSSSTQSDSSAVSLAQRCIYAVSIAFVIYVLSERLFS